ncbi:ferric reductase-like transmembrane domain-containing protein [Aurantiacibacter sp. MUD61]|uniref:ferric reductase-like transmembrane domain-containing protein n=1 Tax=Aurantiacibacter sp. MUD61 TaxID=3009083 RepID=UPI0022F0D3EE|nr:ferric reductase-like transmembrane domain-containing protein [Aurantiacibacter sp. MUD61]
MESKPITPARIYALATVVAFLALASALALSGEPSEWALLSARYSARAAFLMFLLVVSAGPASRYLKSAFWRSLARQRRHLGLAFAALMFLHLAALTINLWQFAPRTFAEIAGGGITYFLITLMALTSNESAQRRMGKWWRRLHWIGINAVLLTFAISYSGRLFRSDYFWTGAVFSPLVLAALALRLEEMRASWFARSSR